MLRAALRNLSRCPNSRSAPAAIASGLSSINAALQDRPALPARSLAGLRPATRAPCAGNRTRSSHRAPGLGFPRVGLAENPAHQLGQASSMRIRQDHQHVGEGAIPALLKRLLRDDVPDVQSRARSPPTSSTSLSSSFSLVLTAICSSGTPMILVRCSRTLLGVDPLPALRWSLPVRST